MQRFLKGSPFLLIALCVGLLLVAACGSDSEENSAAMEDDMASMEKDGDAMEKEGDAMAQLPDNLIAPHFVDSSPGHGEKFAQVPPAIVLNFNFNLNQNSAINITRDGQQVSTSRVEFAANQLSMRTSVTSASEDGVYQVDYKACWPDGSCHDGRLAFVIDAAAMSNYQDIRDEDSITVRMSDLKFAPANLIVSSGTKIEWINDDSAVHFVNTDPHPSHNLLSDMNSFDLEKGESYSFTFNATGEWGYHCSAHFPQGMTGRIIVV